MSRSEKIVAIVNPKAGTLHHKSQLLAALENYFLQANSTWLDFEIWKTEGPGHATELSEKVARDEYGMCISIGGDGTVSETARGLVHTETALGIIPIGSGNGLARHLGISMQPLYAFKQLLHSPINQMDAGLVNGQYFFLATGVGFEGEVAHAFAKQKRRGFFQYLASSTTSWLSYEPILLKWEMEGQSLEERIFTWSAANGSQYGNNARIAPGASVYDGQFNLAWLRPFPLWRGPQLFSSLMNGSLKPSSIYQQKAIQSLVLRLSQKTAGHIDGDPVWFEGNVELSIEKGCLKIVQPHVNHVV